jgi:hypothetical protein
MKGHFVVRCEITKIRFQVTNDSRILCYRADYFCFRMRDAIYCVVHESECNPSEGESCHIILISVL